MGELRCLHLTLLASALGCSPTHSGSGGGGDSSSCEAGDLDCFVRKLSFMLDGQELETVEVPAAPLGPPAADDVVAQAGCPPEALLECSQWISGPVANYQSCTCYYTSGGSETCGGFWHTATNLAGVSNQLHVCSSCESVGGSCIAEARPLVESCFDAESGGPPPTTAITNQPPALAFSAEEPEQSLPLDFVDETGCTPGLCYVPCVKWPCVRSSLYRCTKPVRDGKLAGTAIVTLHSGSTPAQAEAFQLGVTPIGCPDGEDPFEAGATFEVNAGGLITPGDGQPISGEGVRVGVSDTPPSSSSDPTTACATCCGVSCCSGVPIVGQTCGPDLCYPAPSGFTWQDCYDAFIDAVAAKGCPQPGPIVGARCEDSAQ